MILAQSGKPLFHCGHIARGVFPSVFRRQIGGHLVIAPRFAQGFRKIPDSNQSIQLRAQFAQLPLVGFEIPETRDHIVHRHRLAGQHELTAEIIEALEIGERHRAGQQALQHILVEVQMSGIGHVPQILAGGSVNAAVMTVDQRLELGHRTGPRLAVLGCHG